MRILYIGDDSVGSTASMRAAALERLGHQVFRFSLDLSKIIGGNRYLNKFHFYSGYALLQNYVRVQFAKLNSLERFDVVWVDSGELIGANSISLLKKICDRTVLYNHDDPTGPRDWRRFSALRAALPFYDLSCVVRHESEMEFPRFGARKVVRVWRSYDEVGHHPYESIEQVPSSLLSEVCFVGAMIPGENRDGFLLGLLKRDVPVSIWGSHWTRSKYWSELRSTYRGAKLLGRDYVGAIQGSKVSLGLLSKGNRDLHTTRSLEIPYIGSVFCGERTVEHLELFHEDEEAVLWESIDECAYKCKELLLDDTRRKRIAMNGAHAIRRKRVGNEDVCSHVLDLLWKY